MKNSYKKESFFKRNPLFYFDYNAYLIVTVIVLAVDVELYCPSAK